MYIPLLHKHLAHSLCVAAVAHRRYAAWHEQLAKLAGGPIVFYIACKSCSAGYTSGSKKLHLIMQLKRELKSGVFCHFDMHYYIQENKAETECYIIFC